MSRTRSHAALSISSLTDVKDFAGRAPQRRIFVRAALGAERWPVPSGCAKMTAERPAIRSRPVEAP